MGSCRHLKRILVGAVLPLAVAASACGGSTTLSPVAAIAAALAKTSSQNTARVTMTIALTGLPGTQGSVIIPAHGEIDIDHHRADLTMNFPQMAGLPVQIGRMEAIIDGTTFYLRSPTLTQAAHLSTPWIKLDLSKLSPQLADLRSLSPAGSDPSQALEFLRGV